MCACDLAFEPRSGAIECFGQPHVRDKWKRCLNVNHTIQAYYESSKTDDIEMRQVRQRIRSFAWVPAIHKKHVPVDPRLDSHLAQREHYLAVSTDAGDIFILRVTSPHDVLAPENFKWEAKVVFHLQLSSEGSNFPPGTYQNNPPSVIGATALAFSDWDNNDCAKSHTTPGVVFLFVTHDTSHQLIPGLVLSWTKLKNTQQQILSSVAQ